VLEQGTVELEWLDSPWLGLDLTNLSAHEGLRNLACFAVSGEAFSFPQFSYFGATAAVFAQFKAEQFTGVECDFLAHG